MSSIDLDELALDSDVAVRRGDLSLKGDDEVWRVYRFAICNATEVAAYLILQERGLIGAPRKAR